MRTTGSFFVVIPTYGDLAATKRCIDSIVSSTNMTVSIIIVDHGANPIPREAEWDKSVTLIRADSSNWWTGAINIGIEAAIKSNADSIMLMNDDCRLLPGTIETLLSCLQETPTPSIIAPAQTDKDHRTSILNVTSCFLLGFPTVILPGSGMFSRDNGSAIRTKLILGARGVVIPASVFGKIGLFNDQALPHYGADHEFYFRCRRNHIPLFVCAESTVIVDSASGSSAEAPGRLSFGEFWATLHDRKSHTNIPDLISLYKLLYPINHLYMIGVVLNLVRYTGKYLLQRGFFYLCSLGRR